MPRRKSTSPAPRRARARFELTHSQQEALENAERALSIGPIVHLWTADGLGRTTVLERLADTCGGALLSLEDVLRSVDPRQPLAVEEALYEALGSALREHATVLVDDWHLLTAMMEGCNSYPRSGWIEVPMTALASRVEAAGSSSARTGGCRTGSASARSPRASTGSTPPTTRPCSARRSRTTGVRSTRRRSIGSRRSSRRGRSRARRRGSPRSARRGRSRPRASSTS